MLRELVLRSTNLHKVDPAMTAFEKPSSVQSHREHKKKKKIGERTWYFLLRVEILKITVSEPVDRHVMSNVRESQKLRTHWSEPTSVPTFTSPIYCS